MKIFLTIFLFVQVGQLFAQNIDEKNALLWEISYKGSKNKSYLYGSIHSNDRRVFKMSDSVYFALNQAKIIALEIDVFSLFNRLDTRKDDVNLLFDNEGNHYTGNNRASKTMYGDEDGMPQFLDAYFQQYCLNANKQFEALEKVDDQLNLMKEVYMPNENNQINQYVSQVMQDKMIDLYIKGDIYALEKVVKANLSAYEGAYEDIIVKRNQKMALKIDSLVKINSSFFAVGAGHLNGEQGLIQLLRKKGFKLRQITASRSEEIPSFKSTVLSKKSYTLHIDSIDLLAEFGGKPLEKIGKDGVVTYTYRELGQGNTFQVEIHPQDTSLTFEDIGAIYIATPPNAIYNHVLADDGSEYFEGLSDSYPIGYQWIRIIQNPKVFVVIKAYGGNKFMNSNRAESFFNKVWFE